MNPRLWKERATIFSLYGLTGCGCLVLAVILTTVIMKGAPALSGEFLFEESRNFGSEPRRMPMTLRARAFSRTTLVVSFTRTPATSCDCG